MFQLLASTQELFLVNGMSEEGARKAEIAKVSRPQFWFVEGKESMLPISMTEKVSP